MGDSALVRVALHAPSDSYVALGSVLAGTLDFRASQEAAALNPGAPRCVQVHTFPAYSLTPAWVSTSIRQQHGHDKLQMPTVKWRAAHAVHGGGGQDTWAAEQVKKWGWAAQDVLRRIEMHLRI